MENIMEYKEIPGRIDAIKSARESALKAISRTNNWKDERNEKLFIEYSEIRLSVSREALIELFKEEVTKLDKEIKILEEHHDTLSKVAKGLLAE